MHKRIYPNRFLTQNSRNKAFLSQQNTGVVTHLFSTTFFDDHKQILAGEAKLVTART